MGALMAAAGKSIEVKVGVLILLAMGILAGFIVIMGGVNFQPTYTLFVEFDNPGGLQPGAPVKVAGVKVGAIQEVQFRGGAVNPETGKRDPMVRMKIKVEKRYQKSIQESSAFYVTTQGVLGEQFLAIDPGADDKRVLEDGDSVRGLDPPRLDMLLAESYELLHSAVSVMRKNKGEIADAFDGLRKTLKGTGTFFDNNGQKLDRIVTNVEELTINGNDTIKSAKAKYVENPKIDKILDQADTLTSVAAREAPPLIADTRETLKSARKITDSLGSDAEQAKIKQALTDVAEIAKTGKAVMADAQTLVGHIKRGKGTVGSLVMDEQLYDDVQELVRDLKHNPWKFLWRE